MEFDDNDEILCEFLSRRGSVGDEQSFADGTEAGEWRITGFIGRGGSSEVYCVRNKATGEPAALKVLHRTEQRHYERFAREAHCLEELTESAAEGVRVTCGRHFPRFYGKGTVAGRPYIVIELLEPLPLPHADHDVARYLCAVAEGVGYMHIVGIVHRDIKPGNILWRISDRGCRPATAEPVIIDLGLAKDIFRAPIAPDGGLSVVDGKEVGVGTPRYAAPEQFSGGEATPAMDIHALGRLAYECFGGKPPRIWSDIIRRATSSIPGERYQTAADFIRAVRQRHRVRSIAFSLMGVALAASLAAAWLSVGGTDGIRWSRLCEDVTTNIVKDVLYKVDGVTNETYVAGFGNMRGVRPVYHYRPETNRLEMTIVRLGGVTNVFTHPIKLAPDREYHIVGPGTLDAGFVGSKGAKIVLENCLLLNRTRKPLRDARVRYDMGDGSAMDFTEIEKPRDVEANVFITPYSPRDVRFSGGVKRR